MAPILVIMVIACFMPVSSGRAKDGLIAPADVGQHQFIGAIKRKTYSETLQSRFLEDGRAYFVSVSGPGFRVLQITAPSMDKSIADQMRHDASNVERWRELDFEGVELSDGQGRSWSMRLK